MGRNGIATGFSCGLVRQLQHDVHDRQVYQLLAENLPGDAFHQIPHHSPACQPFWYDQPQTGNPRVFSSFCFRLVQPPVQIEKLASDDPPVLKNRRKFRGVVKPVDGAEAVVFFRHPDLGTYAQTLKR